MDFARCVLRLLLLPFALGYGGVVYIRGLLYDLGVLRAMSVPLPTIGVGNLAVGGVGKSPMVSYLVGSLRGRYVPAVLSRGYGRRTRGFREVTLDSVAQEVGDEPLQLKRRYPDVAVFVCESRVEGCRQIARVAPGVQVVVLDDAYQHRQLRVGLEFLLTQYARPFTRDFYFPSGRLRDSKSQRKRAHCVVLTKCPHALSVEEHTRFERRLALPGQAFACSTLRYGRPIPLWDGSVGDREWQGEAGWQGRVVVLTAIASARLFVEYVRSHWEVEDVLSLRDHSPFGARHVSWAEAAVGRGAVVLTTEKDAMRLRDVVVEDSPLAKRICYIPIEVEWLGADGEKVRRLVDEYLGENP